jgi:hypothetical protein
VPVGGPDPPLNAASSPRRTTTVRLAGVLLDAPQRTPYVVPVTYNVHMEMTMTLKRWLPTFLAFPLGGLLAFETVGSATGPATAAAAGLLAGAVIGVGQWLALRNEGIDRRWPLFTAAAMTAGSALAAAVTGAGTEVSDLVLTGAVAGAAVGAAQGLLLGSRAWAVVTAASWALAWLISAGVLAQQADEGFVVFGSSGALVATVLTGLALRREVLA